MELEIQLSAYTAISALGRGVDAMGHALRNNVSGLETCDFDACQLPTHIGRIEGIESVELPDAFKTALSRNNQIACLCLQQDNFLNEVNRVRELYGKKRIGLVLGTSTSGFLEYEHAFQEAGISGRLPPGFNFRDQSDFYATTRFIAGYLNITGPNFTVNTACSTSAKAFISAARMLRLNRCDAVIVGGVDSLCLNTLYGFASLELLAPAMCRPCDVDRDGLNIGEAGAFILLERCSDKSKIQLLGYGESSDAYHMSSPHPDGLGAVAAMRQALRTGGFNPDDIPYINMHGTATRINDAAESNAISGVFGNHTPCSSTKGWTGHTLGAAGALEAVISCLAIDMEYMPGCLNTVRVDPDFNCNVILQGQSKPISRVLSNSFGFGGNNCSLIFGRRHAV